MQHTKFNELELVKIRIYIIQYTGYDFCLGRSIHSFACHIMNKYIYSCVLLSSVYDSEKADDGFLYINYGGESTFG